MPSRRKMKASLREEIPWKQQSISSFVDTLIAVEVRDEQTTLKSWNTNSKTLGVWSASSHHLNSPVELEEKWWEEDRCVIDRRGGRLSHTHIAFSSLSSRFPYIIFTNDRRESRQNPQLWIMRKRGNHLERKRGESGQEIKLSVIVFLNLSSTQQVSKCDSCVICILKHSFHVSLTHTQLLENPFWKGLRWGEGVKSASTAFSSSRSSSRLPMNETHS